MSGRREVPALGPLSGRVPNRPLILTMHVLVARARQGMAIHGGMQDVYP